MSAGACSLLLDLLLRHAHIHIHCFYQTLSLSPFPALAICQSFVLSMCVCFCAVVRWSSFAGRHFIGYAPFRNTFSILSSMQINEQFSNEHCVCVCVCVCDWMTDEEKKSRERAIDKSAIALYCGVNVLDRWTFYHHTIRFIIKYSTEHTRTHLVTLDVNFNNNKMMMISNITLSLSLSLFCRAPLSASMGFVNRLRDHRVFFLVTTFGGFCRGSMGVWDTERDWIIKLSTFLQSQIVHSMV